MSLKKNKNKGKLKRKKSLLLIIICPFIIIVFLQEMIPLFTIMFSGVRTVLQQNAATLDLHMVENRQQALQNEMVSRWGDLTSENELINEILRNYLNEKGISIETFVNNKVHQDEFLQMVFPEMVDFLQRNTTTGNFLILHNGKPTNRPENFTGFYLRDSDPSKRTTTNSDLLMEKGDKNLARTVNITLDSAWATTFHFDGEGVRECDDFFYTPLRVANENKTADMKMLGYWSRPFILEDSIYDNHEVITYSVPLIYNDVIYGINGVEISSAQFNSYFSAKDLDKNSNAGYVLAYEMEDGDYECVTGSGALYDVVKRKGSVFHLNDTKIDGLYCVENTHVGSQGIYAVKSEFNIYGNNVPYDNTKWVLVGLVNEDSIFGMSDNLLQVGYIMIAAFFVLGIVILIIVLGFVVEPFKRLLTSVRGGITGLRNYKPSNVKEIDELQSVIKELTEQDIQSANLLKEEKERYKIAVESSQDIFYSYRIEEEKLEIVNSKDFTGVWDKEQFLEEYARINIDAQDYEKFLELFETKENNFTSQIRIRGKGERPYHWVEISGRRVNDIEGEERRIVGCIRNIHQEKMLQQERVAKKLLDSVTGYYRFEVGKTSLDELIEQKMNGSLLLVRIDHFRDITAEFGLTFGDVIIEELSILFSKCCERLNDTRYKIKIRAGEDSLLAFISEPDAEKIRNEMVTLANDFSSLVHQEQLALHIHCGFAPFGETESAAEVISRTKLACEEAKNRKVNFVEYEEVMNKNAKPKEFDEIRSVGYPKDMPLASLISNLFDHYGSITVALDMLACRLRRKIRLDNLIVTTLRDEYKLHEVVYSYQPIKGMENWDGIIDSPKGQYDSLQVSMEHNVLHSAREGVRIVSELRNTAFDTEGIVIHMSDNRHYIGSIWILGSTKMLLRNEEECKALREIGCVIQNRMNQEYYNKSSKAKADYLARMSHEIRTPMNGIMGMLEIALMEGQSEEKKEDCLRKIKNTSSYLLGLLNDILDMSRIESGNIELIHMEFDMERLISNIEDMLRVKINEYGHDFTKNISLIHTNFIGDEFHLCQILINLLDNAIRYTNRGGNVELTIKETLGEDDSSELYFEIKDNGVGISEENQTIIFQSFEQVQTDLTKSQGTGLGLSISNHLVRLMDGEINLESKAGEGSKFYFSIRLPFVSCDTHSENKGEETLDFAGKRILVAEDNDLNLEIAKTILESYQIKVDEARDGQEAFDKFISSDAGYYNLILMDIVMPNMNGLDATRKIRNSEHPDAETIPILAMSANAFEEDRKRSLSMGMNAHISKPVNVAELELYLKQYMK